jgi:hypothetical protein
LIKTRALEVNIWQYIDLNAKIVPPLFQLTEPTLRDVHLIIEGELEPTAQTVTPTEYAHFQTLKTDFREDIKLFREQERGMARMRSLIQALIQKDLITYTLNCNSARDMLLNLKA